MRLRVTLPLGLLLLGWREAAAIRRLRWRLIWPAATADSSDDAAVVVAQHPPSGIQIPGEVEIRGTADPSPSPSASNSQYSPPKFLCEQALFQAGHTNLPDTPNGEGEGLQ